MVPEFFEIAIHYVSSDGFSAGGEEHARFYVAIGLEAHVESSSAAPSKKIRDVFHAFHGCVVHRNGKSVSSLPRNSPDDACILRASAETPVEEKGYPSTFKGEIIEYGFEMKKDGLADATIETTVLVYGYPRLHSSACILNYRCK